MTLSEHVRAVQSQLKGRDVPEHYALPPEDWHALREEVVAWLKANGFGPYPLAADIAEPNFLLRGVPVVIRPIILESYIPEVTMHDRNGTPLQKGDIISIEYEVTDVQPGVEFCNLTAVSVAGRRPDGDKEYFCGNAAVTTLVRRPAQPADERLAAHVAMERAAQAAEPERYGDAGAASTVTQHSLE